MNPQLLVYGYGRIMVLVQVLNPDYFGSFTLYGLSIRWFGWRGAGGMQAESSPSLIDASDDCARG